MVSASPTSQFDTEEDRKLWGLSSEGPALIVRPAHLHLPFSSFAAMLQSKSHNASNFYLEYFPVHSAFSQTESGFAYKDVIPERHSFTNFLSMDYNLLWMGGGTGEKDSVPVSSAHFDRNENVMTVVRGSKTFHLFDPSLGKEMYGGEAVIKAEFTATVASTSSDGTVVIRSC